MPYLYIALGGAIGAVSRFLIAETVDNIIKIKTFPYLPLGTLAVNIIGSFLIGLIMGLAINNKLFGDQFLSFVVTGILGGFTTFSAFSFETIKLIEKGELIQALIYILLSVVIGVLMAYIGLKLTK